MIILSKKNIYIVFIILLALFVGVLFVVGYWLDNKAEKRVENMYLRNKDEIIDGLSSIVIKNGHHKALLFVHGFMDSPASFADVVNDIKYKTNRDIYVPLLPFHGRNLSSAAMFNNQIILDDLSNQINKLAKEYDSLTVVGMSYGGALLTALENENKLPDNVQIILYAPGFYITSNNYITRLQAHIYKSWRKYCDYKILGCNFPNYDSGDASAIPMFNKEKSLKYVVIPALLELYKFDLKHRQGLNKIKRPYSLIIAVDDNRVSFQEQKRVCMESPKLCHLYPFESGKHIIHWGANKGKFESLIIELTNNNPTVHDLK